MVHCLPKQSQRGSRGVVLDDEGVERLLGKLMSTIRFVLALVGFPRVPPVDELLLMYCNTLPAL